MAKDRDEALCRISILESRLDEADSKNREFRQCEVQKIRQKYIQQLAKKEQDLGKSQEELEGLKEKNSELTFQIQNQKKYLHGKLSRLGKFLQELDCDDKI